MHSRFFEGLHRPETHPPLSTSAPGSRSERSPGRVRGFTLVELVAVVVIIGIFAALAIPQVTRQMRDRRVHETAQRVAQIYRGAKLRALGRGGAVRVRYDDGGGGRIVVHEARVGTGDATCQFLPNPSCGSTDWADVTADATQANEALEVEVLAAENVPVDGLQIEMQTQDGDEALLDVCYTPAGRTFVNTTAGATPAWAPMNSVAVAQVYRQSGGSAFGLTRRVFILPSGGARLAL